MNHNKITAGTKNKIIKITLSKNTIKKIFKKGKLKSIHVLLHTCSLVFMTKKPTKTKKM